MQESPVQATQKNRAKGLTLPTQMPTLNTDRDTALVSFHPGETLDGGGNAEDSGLRQCLPYVLGWLTGPLPPHVPHLRAQMVPVDLHQPLSDDQS